MTGELTRTVESMGPRSMHIKVPGLLHLPTPSNAAYVAPRGTAVPGLGLKCDDVMEITI